MLNRQRCGAVVRVDGKIGGKISRGRFRLLLIDDKGEANAPFDLRSWSLEPDERRLDIELPPHPHEGVSLFHQEAVAEVGRGSWILTSVGRAIEAPEESLAPAIGDLEQQRAVALLRVNRSKDVQVSREVHAAI